MAYNPINLGPTGTAFSQAVVLPSDQVAISTIQTASATGGVTPVTGSSTGGPTSLSITGSPAQVYGWYFYNPNTVAAYILFYNASSVTVGSGTPVYVLVIPPAAGANVFGLGIIHSVAICIGISQSRGAGTAMSTAVDYNVFYK